MGHPGAYCRALACAALLAAMNGVEAGQACEEKPVTAQEMRQAFGLALKVRESLDASGAEVALLARVGQDLSKYGLRYSHLAFVWRDHPHGRWLGVHLLNECGTAHSTLYNQGLANFFADDMHAWEAMIVLPSAALQAGLAAELGSTRPLALHQPAYNMLAYPFSTRYQNSNQWVLEVLADAETQASSPGRAGSQAWLAAEAYRPDTLRLPSLTRLGGRLFRANVAFDDHPFERRMSGRIDVVSVESVVAFLERHDGARRLVVRL